MNNKLEGRCPDRPYLTVAEVAAMHSTSKEAIRKAIRTGRLPAFITGNHYFVTRSDAQGYCVDPLQAERGRGHTKHDTDTTKKPARTLHVFVDSEDVDAVVAYDEEDAWAVWTETTGIPRDDCDPATAWRRKQSTDLLTIDFEDETVWGDVGPATRTFGEWARLNGRGILCSTEW